MHMILDIHGTSVGYGYYTKLNEFDYAELVEDFDWLNTQTKHSTSIMMRIIIANEHYPYT